MNPLIKLFATPGESDCVRVIDRPHDLAHGVAELSVTPDHEALVIHPLRIDGSAIQRVVMLCILRIRMAGARRMLLRAGASKVAAFAVLPSLEAPTFVYELASPAGAYGRKFLRLYSDDRFKT